MRELNRREILINQTTVNFQDNGYNRLGLISNSNIPLINSLNELTYLVANSELTRETISTDGTLERLIHIMKSCNINIFELLEIDKKIKNKSTNPNELRRLEMLKQSIFSRYSWKWTLCLQCLVLTGSRGTAFIREKIVEVGVIPILATILDNYLLFHKRFNIIKYEKFQYSISTFESETFYQLYRKNDYESYEEFLYYLADPAFTDGYNSKPESDTNWGSDMNSDQIKTANLVNIGLQKALLLTPTMMAETDIPKIWNDSDKIEESYRNSYGTELYSTQFKEDKPLETNDDYTTNNNLYSSSLESNVADDSFRSEEPFSQEYFHTPLIDSPREFLLGRIIPKDDDIIWSLQLLAFLSKYPSLKEHLLDVQLVESLSIRPSLNLFEKRLQVTHQITDDMSLLNINNTKRSSYESCNMKLRDKSSSSETSSSGSDSNIREGNPEIVFALFHNLPPDNKQEEAKEKFTRKSKVTSFKLFNHRFKNFKYHPDDKGLNINGPYQKRREYEAKIAKQYRKTQKINWESPVNATEMNINKESMKLNIFPLVERYTSTKDNTKEAKYWSSVIMRNYCRKDEVMCIRQCGNLFCGEWESYPREFSKCRRCKRTKYCSRECQIKAWKNHRHWCQEAYPSTTTTGTIASNVPIGSVLHTVRPNSNTNVTNFTTNNLVPTAAIATATTTATTTTTNTTTTTTTTTASMATTVATEALFSMEGSNVPMTMLPTRRLQEAVEQPNPIANFLETIFGTDNIGVANDMNSEDNLNTMLNFRSNNEIEERINSPSIDFEEPARDDSNRTTSI
ncbi:hypothetical protein TBLA_0I01340 [Henningerozyma blattae CBS 6284]|uniref:MYND-type domain-containing protein n=1 Tax=Henningerozyma blattae (strain ATCC 34711 / CBS 6284 / DSM 70876 / NBRC 10599 / NRRL Y-10934 / UCD 77-7) TaxID=1071380 RepID=I2H8U2_HENB6|nr:hypothetical protein TBLA_0I01340 [Tetrapisispora blattae CBS 6284]CCH62794.1 hypothetical protein TBLA_0I01340 [Tetrapisispora blattae CBS 6284]